MPYNHSKLEQRLRRCDRKLFNLFLAQEELTPELKRTIKAVEEYYNLSYTKAYSKKTIEQIAQSYELFVNQLTLVKKGALNSDNLLNSMKQETSNRKMRGHFYNLAKACECMFWSALTFSLLSLVFGVVLPTLILGSAIIGLALGITVIGAMFHTAYKAASCLTQFKSVSRHRDEYNHEVALISFFKPKQAAQVQNEKNTLLDEESALLCC